MTATTTPLSRREQLPPALRGADRVLSTIENVLAATSLGAAVAIALGSVVLRFFDVFLFWSEEAIIYLIILSTFIGAVVTLREQDHVNVDMVSVFLKARGKRFMAILGAVVCLFYLVVVGISAWQLIFEPFSSNTVTPGLKVPLWVVELAVPVGFTLMCLRGLESIWRAWRFDPPDEIDDALASEAAAIGLDADDIERARSRGGDDD